MMNTHKMLLVHDSINITISYLDEHFARKKRLEMYPTEVLLTLNLWTTPIFIEMFVQENNWIDILISLWWIEDNESIVFVILRSSLVDERFFSFYFDLSMFRKDGCHMLIALRNETWSPEHSDTFSLLSARHQQLIEHIFFLVFRQV